MTLDIEAPERLRATSVAQLRERLGDELGVSDWCPVTQEQVAAFAEATGDHQHASSKRSTACPRTSHEELGPERRCTHDHCD